MAGECEEISNAGIYDGGSREVGRGSCDAVKDVRRVRSEPAGSA